VTILASTASVLNSVFLAGTSTKVGLIILVKENDETGGFKRKWFSFVPDEADLTAVVASARLWCAFTTSSMAVAYASSLDPEPQVGRFFSSNIDLDPDSQIRL
jgi:hypothetical protein